MDILQRIAVIQKAFSGESIIDICYDQGVGRLDREPVLQPDKPKTDSRGKHPEFFEGDGMSREPSNKDPIGDLK